MPRGLRILEAEATPATVRGEEMQGDASAQGHPTVPAGSRTDSPERSLPIRLPTLWDWMATSSKGDLQWQRRSRSKVSSI